MSNENYGQKIRTLSERLLKAMNDNKAIEGPSWVEFEKIYNELFHLSVELDPKATGRIRMQAAHSKAIGSVLAKLNKRSPKK